MFYDYIVIMVVYLLGVDAEDAARFGVGLLLQERLSNLCGSTLKKLGSLVGWVFTISGSTGLVHRPRLLVFDVGLDKVCSGIV